MSPSTDPQTSPSVIGNAQNFWLYSPTTGYDLTHPPTSTSPPISPRLTIQTTTQPITLDPAKTALIIIDMQNFFLSPALDRARGAGHAATSQLAEHAIPAARKAGVRILWVNWGLTDEELEAMPPAVRRAFSSLGRAAGGEFEEGLGTEMGTVKGSNGEAIEAGRMLVRESWNAALFPPLDGMFEEGSKLQHRPDLWVHKNRMSGLWGGRSALGEVLEELGIRSLLFAGVNTDQCVGGTYQDAFSKGFDCILLDDGCGTTSPEFSQRCIEYNVEHTWGFRTSCRG